MHSVLSRLAPPSSEFLGPFYTATDLDTVTFLADIHTRPCYILSVVQMWKGMFVEAQRNVHLPPLMANQALRQIVAGYRMRAPESCPPEIYTLMRRTWHMNPDMRPSFAKILTELVAHLDTCSGDKVTVTQRKSPPFHLNLSNRFNEDDPWQQKSFGRVTMTPDRFVESSSDCYDQLDELPIPGGGGAGVVNPNSHLGSASVMSRSFTSGNSANGLESRHKDLGQASSSTQAITPDVSTPSNRTAFCLPKFERLKL
ncbi:unnamed protein product [Echinostoma caproni]|uniref:Pkinase_Tyr domain-containing protein n=1 Tax=Echinostoma caproni TaxID=27848 RepID=A0A183AR20_9TREM|nr:unnamed protein product [Echinostoma caproni]